MTAHLLSDPAALAAEGSLAARHVAGFRLHGTPALITNAACEVLLLKDSGNGGDMRLPITVDDGTRGRSYVSSPHSTYVLYPRDEIALMGLGGVRYAAEAVLGVLAGLLRISRLARAVHLDNWLLSTNLHGAWDGAGLAGMRELLTAHYPDHFVILRSVDAWSCPALLDAACADGWTLLPARQVWVTDDLARDWRPRNNTANDRRGLLKSGLVVDAPGVLSPADCDRIAVLYRQLYIARYSAINPVFTAHFVAMSAASGLLTYRLLRDPAGTIMAFAALRCAGGIATVPLMGYDTARPQSEGLYRSACYIAADLAMSEALAFHGSAGASQFKRNRGARGVIEYMAVDGRHLSRNRQAGLAMLAAGLRQFMVPLLQQRGW